LLGTTASPPGTARATDLLFHFARFFCSGNKGCCLPFSPGSLPSSPGFSPRIRRPRHSPPVAPPEFQPICREHHLLLGPLAGAANFPGSFLFSPPLKLWGGVPLDLLTPPDGFTLMLRIVIGPFKLSTPVSPPLDPPWTRSLIRVWQVWLPCTRLLDCDIFCRRTPLLM